MKAQIISVAILVSVLLALGCASESQQPQDNSTNVSAPAKTMPLGVQNDNGGDASSGAAAPTVANDTMPVGNAPAASACIVDFQRGMGETYYVMVKTDASGEITVSCPDGTPASRTGNAFFCEKLALPSPVVAYIGGTECGSAKFAVASKGENSFLKASPEFFKMPSARHLASAGSKTFAVIAFAAGFPSACTTRE